MGCHADHNVIARFISAGITIYNDNIRIAAFRTLQVIGLAVFAIVLFISKIVSLSSLIATVTVVSLSIVFYNQSGAIWPQALFSIVMGVMIFVKHRENIKRLISGEEAKLSVGRKG